MPNQFSARADVVLQATVACLVVSIVAAGAGLVIYGNPSQSYAQSRTQPQPVMFSHEHHVGSLGLECMYCHASAGTSDFAGMPSASTCMHCHDQLYTTAPILQPVRDASRTGEPLRWTRVYRLPDHVFFSHKVHVQASIGCRNCHGDMEAQSLTAQRSPMTMGWCLDCHRHTEPRLLTAPSPPVGYVTPGENKSRGQVDRTDLLTNCSACHY